MFPNMVVLKWNTFFPMKEENKASPRPRQDPLHHHLRFHLQICQSYSASMHENTFSFTKKNSQATVKYGWVIGNKEKPQKKKWIT